MEIHLLIALRGVKEGDETSQMIQDSCPEIATISYAYSKMGVLQGCRENPKINVVLLGENLQGSSPYTAADINEIHEVRDELRVVPIIMDEHYGTDYMQRLFYEAIYCAVMEKDARIEYVCSIIQKGRGKKEARLYYGVREDDLKSVETASDSISSCVDHIMNGGPMEESEVRSRAVYVKSRLSEKEMRAVIACLSDEVVDMLRDCAELEDFFPKVEDEISEEPVAKEEEKSKEVVREVVRTVPVIKKREIKIPVPTLVKGRKENGESKVVYLESQRAVIGVIGQSAGCGSTTVALNVAKVLSENLGYVPTFVQFPGTRDTAYSTLKMDELFGESFVNHLALVSNNQPPSDVQNEYGGIRYVVDDGAGEFGWSYVKSVRLLGRIGYPCILDIGSAYLNGFVPVMNECSHIIVVLDSMVEPNIDELRKVKEMASASGKCLIFVNNHSGGDYDMQVRNATHSYATVDIPVQMDAAWNKKIGDGHVFFTNVAKKDSPFVEIVDGMGLPSITRRDSRPIGAVEKKEAVRFSGTIEVGFLGMARGVGTTHTALMCAASFAGDYKVAYLEIGDRYQIGTIPYYSGLSDEMSDTFSYRGIDFYRGMSCAEFLANYRQQYSVIIYDFGELRDFPELSYFFALQNKYVVFPSAIWRRKEVDDFTSMMAEKYNPGKDVICIFPFLKEGCKKELSYICEGFCIEGVGMEQDAFLPSDDVVQNFQKDVFISAGMLKKKRKGLLWRRKR